MPNTVITERAPALIEKRRGAIQQTISYMKINREALRDILTEVSTFQTAEEEIDTAIHVLENAFKEVETHRPPVISSMSVFMPSNVLLYSYVLYLLIPSLYVEKIEFRGSSQVIDQVRKLHKVLYPIHGLPIEMLELSHRKFMKESALLANAVVFTGSYQNAENIKFQLSREQLFVFFGHGVNPFILEEHADIAKSVRDVITIRTFNSGQDCMGPDVIYVPAVLQRNFLSLLESGLKELKFGGNQDPSAEYGPIHYSSAVDIVASHLNQFHEFIHFGGHIDYRSKVIHPTILYSTLQDELPIKEFFSPIFNVVVYDSLEELKTVLNSGYFRERAMGASFYGNKKSSFIEFLKRKHTVSINGNLLDIENGNEEFGGYGPMANYISYQKQLHIQPLLLSKVLRDHWEEEES
ncbi:aldehyde dehydrogenase [Peribacillus simplex]|uniref:aldehyde dehydrogenase family protein n=1 Tax=Peribacillus simplex TaxID=1478 RepID=UPI000F64504D|nr:aldehyde dehydrogenase family protein [Peribacillus simplex]RRN69536.1 aldehyde dehydrogenase [Peribacillus simplex]